MGQNITGEVAPPAFTSVRTVTFPCGLGMMTVSITIKTALLVTVELRTVSVIVTDKCSAISLVTAHLNA